MLPYKQKIRLTVMTTQSYVLMCDPLPFKHLKVLQSTAWSKREGVHKASRLI